jgi:hypothetical protein
METSEKIVEAYFRYVRLCTTIVSVRCGGQHEIDLIAVAPNGERYHIEVGVTTAQGFRKLKADREYRSKRKEGLRRTVGYFIRQKFRPRSVLAKLHEHGISPGRYRKVIVSNGWTPAAGRQAEKANIELLDFRADILMELKRKFGISTEHLADDTARTMQFLGPVKAWEDDARFLTEARVEFVAKQT